MSCVNCSSNNIFTGSFNQIPSSNCCDSQFTSATNSIVYDGPNLPCTLVQTGESLNTVLSKFDNLICSATGDYSTYNKFCLDDLLPITTEKQFVETISEFVCTLKTNFDLFVGTTFPAYQTAVDVRFDAIEVPGLTCASAGVVPTDTLNQLLGKYCNKFSSIDTKLDISSVNWAQCFSVPITPASISQGFDLLIDQICQVEASSGAVLPTFNNIGSCLPGTLTANDTLVDTVNKIKTKVCTQPTFDINALTWTCVTKPSVNTTDLQSAFQTVLTELAAIKQNYPTFSPSDFAVANVDNGNPCLGKLITISGAVGTDEFVKASPVDTLPGTLQDKLFAGTNISLDYVSIAGKVIINATGSGSTDEKVKSYLGDPTAGFLNDKVIGGNDPYGITINTNLNVTTNQVEFIPTIDTNTLVTNILNQIKNDDTLRALFCEIVGMCPSPCGGAQNVQVVQL